jgi:hypothetical protein
MGSIIKRIKYNFLSYALYDLFLRAAPDKTKAFIFVATTGRTGSTSLRTIFGGLSNCASFHEPHPLLGNKCPAGMDRTEYYKRQFYTRKLPIIRLSAFNRDYYVETNHQFVKHFAEHAIHAFGDRIRIIHLVRDPVKVASSFYSFNSVPGTTSKGRKYLLDPGAGDNLIQVGDLLETGEFSHDYFKCVWYWYEVETRVRKLRSNFPQVKWYQLQTEDLNRPEVLQEMFATFDLPAVAGSHVSASPRENLKTEKKLRTITRGEAESMHDSLLCQMETRYGRSFWVVPKEASPSRA